MKRILFIALIFQVITFYSSAQTHPRKYYCPPCNCIHDGKLFEKPGNCPDPGCNMELLPVEGDYQESKVKIWVTFWRTNWLLRLYDILIFPAIIQGLILGLILIFRKNANKIPARFLAALIVALSLQNIKFYYFLNVLISYISNTGGNPEYNIRSLSFPISGVLFIGPALYFYVRSLTQSDFRFTLKNSFHFLPGLLFILINALVFFGIVNPNNQVHSTLVNFFTTLSTIENFAAIALSFYYIFISMQLMRRHEAWVYEHFSTTSRKSLHWLRHLIISLSFVWIIWLFAVVTNFFTRDFILTYLSSYPFQIATSIIIFWIGYVGFIQGEIFSLEISFEKKIDDLKIINKKEVPTNSEVQNSLLKAMEIDKLYLIPELTLALLSHQLNLSPKSISQTLNNDLKKNFHDFINEYRVEEVKKRLLSNDYENLTLLAIAQDSGFNSKSSFNRVFMKVTGMSPKEFKDRNGNIQP